MVDLHILDPSLDRIRPLFIFDAIPTLIWSHDSYTWPLRSTYMSLKIYSYIQH